MSVESGFAHVDGRRLHWLAAGAGSPTVVLEAGLTGSASEWTHVLPRLAAATRVISASRAGYGESDPAPRRSALASVDDLEEVLAQSGSSGPFVLVGHSWGGMLVRLLAARRPQEVAAVVLVDATHERLARMRRRRAPLLGALGMTVAARRARTGRLLADLRAGKGEVGEVYCALPADLQQAMAAELTDSRTWQQARRDYAGIAPLLRGVHRRPLPPLDVPVVAVVGERSEPRAAHLRAYINQTYAGWLAELPDGRLVPAPQSGHLVPLQDEDLLVDVVTRLVNEVRRGREPQPPLT